MKSHRENGKNGANGSGSKEGAVLDRPTGPKIEPLSLLRLEEETRRVDLRPSDAPEEPQIAFRKIALLGKGDVGKVYLVNRLGTNELYAMKVLKKSDMIQRNKVKRVLAEREILATTSHPFIVTLYSCFQTNDCLYYVLDYCAGGEFFRTLQRQPGMCLNEDAARFYGAEVLLALEYLHFMGFIYRDLKPENILLHHTGHVVLSDFDLSKRAGPVQSPVFLESSGKKQLVDSEPDGMLCNSFVGTEEYIAPEIIRGLGHTSAVDWWTFGILLYEMLYGTTPFRGRNMNDTFSHIVKGDLKFSEFPAVSKDAKALIKSLLRADPKKRLGHAHGASEIKGHPFFKGINWPLIRTFTPPIIPYLDHPLDTRHFAGRPKDDEDVGRVVICPAGVGCGGMCQERDEKLALLTLSSPSRSRSPSPTRVRERERRHHHHHHHRSSSRRSSRSLSPPGRSSRRRGTVTPTRGRSPSPTRYRRSRSLSPVPAASSRHHHHRSSRHEMRSRSPSPRPLRSHASLRSRSPSPSRDRDNRGGDDLDPENPFRGFAFDGDHRSASADQLSRLLGQSIASSLVAHDQERGSLPPLPLHRERDRQPKHALLYSEADVRDRAESEATGIHSHHHRHHHHRGGDSAHRDRDRRCEPRDSDRDREHRDRDRNRHRHRDGHASSTRGGRSEGPSPQ